MFLFPYEVQIPEVNDISRQISQNKYRVLPVYGINKKGKPPGKAEVPEGYWNDARLLSFGFNPLDQKSHGEQCLTDEPHDDPEVNFECWVLSRVARNYLSDPIHLSTSLQFRTRCGGVSSSGRRADRQTNEPFGF